MKTISVNLSVSIFREGDKYIAYAPSLELSTSGNSLEEVKKRFNEIVGIFVEEITEAGTTQDVLSDLGWQINGDNFAPPVLIGHEMQKIELPV